MSLCHGSGATPAFPSVGVESASAPTMSKTGAKVSKHPADFLAHGSSSQDTLGAACRKALASA